MSLYNIVGSASLQGGQPEDVSQVLANFQAIQTILNGGIDDANVRSTAAITPTKLANYPWKNSDIDPAAAIVLSKLAGYPADATKFARGDGVWALPGIYRKVTPKAVVNSIAETDLLNGEITIPAGLMGISGGIRLTMMGDCVNNSAATQAAPVFKLKLGATTILATAATAAMWAASATRGSWRFVAEIQNLGAANSQWSNLQGMMFDSMLNNLFSVFATGQGSSGTAAMDIDFIQGGNASAIDTTLAQVLAFTVILPAANALLDMTLKSAVVEII